MRSWSEGGKTFHPEVQLCRGRKFALHSRPSEQKEGKNKRQFNQRTLCPKAMKYRRRMRQSGPTPLAGVFFMNWQESFTGSRLGHVTKYLMCMPNKFGLCLVCKTVFSVHAWRPLPLPFPNTFQAVCPSAGFPGLGRWVWKVANLLFSLFFLLVCLF